MGKSYGLIDRDTMRNKNISLRAKGLYAYLCSLAGSTGVCYPSRRTACGYLKICDSTLTSLLRELTEENLISCEKKRSAQGKFQKNIYTINAFSAVHGNNPHGEDVHITSVTDSKCTNIIN